MLVVFTKIKKKIKINLNLQVLLTDVKSAKVALTRLSQKRPLQNAQRR